MIVCGYCRTPLGPGVGMVGTEDSVPCCSEECHVAFMTDGGYLDETVGRPAATRAQLEQIPAGTELLRTIRTYTVDQLAELTDDDLEHAARWLRLAAYCAKEGARRLDAERVRRVETTSTEGDPDGDKADPPA